MNDTSLAIHFLTSDSVVEGGKPKRHILRRNVSTSEIRRFVEETPFNTAYDMLRTQVAEKLQGDDAANVVAELREVMEVLSNSEIAENRALIMKAAIMQILTAACIVREDCTEAKSSAASALNLLAQEPKRKDEPFLTVFGALLYDVASLHGRVKEFKQAERAIEKSLKIFERLSRENPDRYGSALIMVQTALTNVDGNRKHQAELLTQYQAATSEYLKMLGEGVEGAATRLVDSLFDEGQMLAKMGRHREAIQYFSRALKYLTRNNPPFDLRQLEMSIALGESLLNVAVTRDKGIHLLNTMLHKATKINANDAHRLIVDILLNAKSRNLDILGFWHKVFPR